MTILRNISSSKARVSRKADELIDDKRLARLHAIVDDAVRHGITLETLLGEFNRCANFLLVGTIASRYAETTRKIQHEEQKCITGY